MVRSELKAPLSNWGEIQPRAEKRKQEGLGKGRGYAHIEARTRPGADRLPSSESRLRWAVDVGMGPKEESRADAIIVEGRSLRMEGTRARERGNYFCEKNDNVIH